MASHEFVANPRCEWVRQRISDSSRLETLSVDIRMLSTRHRALAEAAEPTTSEYWEYDLVLKYRYELAQGTDALVVVLISPMIYSDVSGYSDTFEASDSPFVIPVTPLLAPGAPSKLIDGITVEASVHTNRLGKKGRKKTLTLAKSDEEVLIGSDSVRVSKFSSSESFPAGMVDIEVRIGGLPHWAPRPWLYFPADDVVMRNMVVTATTSKSFRTPILTATTVTPTVNITQAPTMVSLAPREGDVIWPQDAVVVHFSPAPDKRTIHS